MNTPMNRINISMTISKGNATLIHVPNLIGIMQLQKHDGQKSDIQHIQIGVYRPLQ